MTQKIITANRLRDGDVVYLTGHGTWSASIADSQVVADAAGETELLERAAESEKDQEVVGVYAMAVALDGDEIRPIGQREIIRAKGPTVRLDLGKQAEWSC